MSRRVLPPCDGLAGVLADPGRYRGCLQHCSDDRVEVWHGRVWPAITCGYHWRYAPEAVFAGASANLTPGSAE